MLDFLKDYKLYLILGIGALFIFSNMYIALQTRKTAEQQEKIIQWQSQNPKVLYKKESMKFTNTDMVIKPKKDATVELSANGDMTVHGEAEITYKKKEKEKVSEKKDTIPVYKLPEAGGLYLGANYYYSGMFGLGASVSTGNFLFGAGLQFSPEIKVINADIGAKYRVFGF